jgi:hypothetical protein
MKVSPLLLIAMSVVLLGGTLYAAVAFLVTPRMRLAGVPDSLQANAPGGGDGVALAALRDDLELLRAEMHAGRSTESDSGRHRTASDPRQLSKKLGDELRRLRAEVAMLRTAVEQTAAMATTPAGHREKAAKPLLRSGDDMAARIQAREQGDYEHRAALDTYMDAEGVDTQWSVDTTDVLTQVLASAALAATVVQDIECRTTVCRLDVEHEDRQELDQFALMLPMQVAEGLPQVTFFHDQGADGRIHTVVYLTRQGHSLPALAR